MRCPEPISTNIIGILKYGILQARAAAWSGDAERCAALTDHIHNLPDLLANFSNELLVYYLEVERPAFISSVGAAASAAYSDFWEDLQTHCDFNEPTAAKS